MRERAAAQLLDRPATGDVAEVVRHLLCVQAQDVAAHPLAFRARMRGVTADQVAEVRRDRTVVRFWGPRGTLHLAAAEDLSWLHPLLRPSPAGSLRRLRELGAETSEEAAVAAVGHALEGAGPLGKAELGELLGLEGQAILHYTALAARAGLVVLGPDRGGKATYVHAADWLGAPLPVVVDEDRALRELAVRFRRAQGPAEPGDLAAWSGLSLAKARRAWRSLPDPDGAAVPGGPFVRLVPAFDEYLMGRRDQGLTAAQRRAVRPGGGVIRAAVIVDGRIAGTWSGGEAVLFAAEEREQELAAEFADVARFRAGR
ncbi:DNA glycosylase AlkZ-like family protein [Actinocorallia longicatena]|uniref:Winged helix DNA-binding domain-containing protein n=1 Tax=Actinocorallia longicatena TaxID=111803 RepID=A0ABP6QMK1_9ACTN